MSTSPPKYHYEKLEDMPNIGKIAAKKLREAGIQTPDDLCAISSQEALLRLREHDSGVCLSMLCGLKGAICGVRWHNLPDEKKKELKDFHKNL
ncbi:MAG: TfoX/Sxy family protein [Methanimicrococcus sp.]|nr:TfoX/Sxy family protein [Methanimicrococcus sp.]